MELRDIEYFLAVSRTMNFTRAAEQCGVTQPTLTRAIQKLERELGGLLVARERNLTHLTPLGRLVQPQLEELASRSRNLRRQAQLHARLDCADLRLGVMCSVGPQRFGAFFSRFRAENAGIEILLADATPERLAERLLQGEFDAALTVLPAGFGERLQVEPLYAERYVVACGPDHPFAARDGITMRDMDGQTYLTRINCEHAELLGEALRAAGATLVMAARSEREDWIQALAAAGMGVCFLPEFSPAMPGWATCRVADSPVAREVCLLTVAGRRWSGAMARFVEAVRRTQWLAAADRCCRRPRRRGEVDVAPEPSAAEPRTGRAGGFVLERATLALIVFGAVLLVIVLDLADMTVVAMIGVSAAILLGLVTSHTAAQTLALAGEPLALLFGGMVVARVLIPTGLFDWAGVQLCRLSHGSGRRLLLGILLLVAPICALLPNATVVLLVGPAVIRAARLLGLDFVPPLILVVLASNSAGLLTLVGDPASFIAGSAAGLTFSGYLRLLSPGGLLVLLVLPLLAPLLFREAWRHRGRPVDIAAPALSRPGFLAGGLSVLVGMAGLFVWGDALPRPIGPPAAAILAATAALLVAYQARVEPVAAVFRDIDWHTLLFIVCMFVLVVMVVSTGALAVLYGTMGQLFGDRFLLAGLVLMAGIGAASALVPNVPLMAAMVMLAKGYLVFIEVAPEAAMHPGFADWPDGTLVVFAGMMLGGTIGGNATLIGSASNVVAAGIAAREGRRIGFAGFLRFGVPVTLAQLAVAGLYLALVLGPR